MKETESLRKKEKHSGIWFGKEENNGEKKKRNEILITDTHTRLYPHKLSLLHYRII